MLTQLPAAPTPAAALAVATALSAVGDPYVWGAAGPNRFDCSGLVLWSWGKAGVQLAHWTGFQVHEGWPIDLKDLLPGDLIFMWRPHAKGGPPDHVAMYIGNHLIVQAPHIGGYVEVSSMWWWPGARRTAVRLAAPAPRTRHRSWRRSPQAHQAGRRCRRRDPSGTPGSRSRWSPP